MNDIIKFKEKNLNEGVNPHVLISIAYTLYRSQGFMINFPPIATIFNNNLQ